MEYFINFTPDDLTLLSRAAVMAGAAVALARYSGRGGTDNEFQSIVSALEAAARQYPSNPLVQALLTAEARQYTAGLARQFKSDTLQTTFQDFKLAALNRCAQVVELLDQKAPADQALEVRHSILTMCRTVAQASKEGGWHSSDPVDVKEEGVLEELARVLGVIVPSA